MNALENLLSAREQPKTTRDDSAVLEWLQQGIAPEQRLLKFDGWARKQLETKLDWTWAGDQKAKRIEQCRIHLERIVIDLWKRGWLLDGRKLSAHIVKAIDAVAAYQKAGKIENFWAYFSACISRYVGANAEEIQVEAMSAGSHIGQVISVLGLRGAVRHATLPELIAQRKGEIQQEQTLRSKLSRARKAQTDKQQQLL